MFLLDDCKHKNKKREPSDRPMTYELQSAQVFLHRSVSFTHLETWVFKRHFVYRNKYHRLGTTF